MKKLAPLVVALSAVAVFAGALSASASELLFQAESFPVTLQGSGNQTFETKAGIVSCPTSLQKGEGKSAATWWSVKVADSGCTLNGEPASVAWGECEIRYYTYSGLYIVCKGGGVKISSGECAIEIPPQELESVFFTEIGSETTRSIGASVEVSGLKSTQGAGCKGGAGTFGEGAMGGGVTLKGFTGKGVQQGISIE